MPSAVPDVVIRQRNELLEYIAACTEGIDGYTKEQIDGALSELLGDDYELVPMPGTIITPELEAEAMAFLRSRAVSYLREKREIHLNFLRSIDARFGTDDRSDEDSNADGE